MRVVLPYASGFERDAAKALSATGWGYEFVYVGDSDRAYYDLLWLLWDLGETFCVVEHDIEVHATALDELDACPHDWCSFPFEYAGAVTHGLGCAKFSADLIVRQPDALTRVGVMSDDRHEKRHWCRLDAWLTCVLEGGGEHRHEHETLVRHLNPGPSHSCATNPTRRNR